MALDYGEKYIGIAVNEPLFNTVHGRDTLVRKNLASDISYILEQISNEDVGLLLVGLPLNEDGEETATSAKVRSFVRNIQKKMHYSSRNHKKVEIRFWNERYTTQDADLILEEKQIPRSERKKYIDKIAAILLLEDYLAARK